MQVRLWPKIIRSWSRTASWRPLVPLLSRWRSELAVRRVVAYGAALGGVVLATVVIGIAQAYVHVANLSLVYLLVVLWLASVFGRGPAVLAAVLAFFAYDYFFIAPLYRLTVADPTAWIALFALLATAVVLGQLTASVQAQAREAQESQRRMATLYALSQFIASATDFEPLLAALAGRVVEVFASAGVVACGLLLPDAQGQPVARAAASAARHDNGAAPALAGVRLEDREQRAQAAWALEHCMPVGGQVVLTGLDAPHTVVCYFVPLLSRGHAIGVLGIAGTQGIRRLVTWSGMSRKKRVAGALPRLSAALEPQTELFRAFSEQIAWALDRDALQRQAIHAEALRESDRLKDALLGSVTHELRTPLASIKAAAGSLLDPAIAWSETDQREMLESITMSTERLNRLVGNLLDLSQLEAGVAAPEKDWYLIGDAVATVLDRLDIAGQLAGRKIVVDLPDDLPLVPMDHAQLEQVLTNVLENALKYSPPETPVQVRARVLGQPAELEVRVTDHGIGIPASEIQAIFGKFYRVKQSATWWRDDRPPIGTGLGLAICDAIVQAHGGRIWAESRVGAGTTLALTLPIPPDAPHGQLPELEHLADASSAVRSGAQAEALP